MQTSLYAIGFSLLGYLCGSLPFAVWITHRVKGVDVRDSGSGHATATNTFRQAGLLPAILVFALDLAKGFIPTWLALHYAPATWIAPLTAGLTVAGHCWPVFAQFRGGMGLATSSGIALAASPIAFLICGVLLGALLLILRHSARASALAGLLITPLLWLFGFRGQYLWMAAAVGAVLFIRFLVNWNRQYRELWLDREKKGS